MSREEKLSKLTAEKNQIESAMNDPKLCEGTASIYERVTGYYRNVSNWNKGKSQEEKDRKAYTL